MSLKKLCIRVDERREGEVFEGDSLSMSSDEINQLHKDLSILEIKDIKLEGVITMTNSWLSTGQKSE